MLIEMKGKKEKVDKEEPLYLIKYNSNDQREKSRTTMAY
jgi:hypothetical protein